MKFYVLTVVSLMAISSSAFSKEKTQVKETTRKPASGEFTCMVTGSIDDYSNSGLRDFAAYISSNCDTNKPFSLSPRGEGGRFHLCCTASTAR